MSDFVDLLDKSKGILGVVSGLFIILGSITIFLIRGWLNHIKNQLTALMALILELKNDIIAMDYANQNINNGDYVEYKKEKLAEILENDQYRQNLKKKSRNMIKDLYGGD